MKQQPKYWAKGTPLAAPFIADHWTRARGLQYEEGEPEKSQREKDEEKKGKSDMRLERRNQIGIKFRCVTYRENVKIINLFMFF
jgi:hypothetical protein